MLYEGKRLNRDLQSQILQLTVEVEKLRKTIKENQQDVANVRKQLEQHLNKTFFTRD